MIAASAPGKDLQGIFEFGHSFLGLNAISADL
jgi:hypothetical protein